MRNQYFIRFITFCYLIVIILVVLGTYGIRLTGICHIYRTASTITDYSLPSFVS